MRVRLSLVVWLTSWLLGGGMGAEEVRDPIQGIFPPEYDTLQDVQRLPVDHTGCGFVRTHGEGLIAYGGECKGVPSYPESLSDEPTESRLALRGTGLTSLHVGDFTTWGLLTSLKIEMNVFLRELEPRIFYHMTSLTNLSISNNRNLRHLDPELFDGLINLKELRFIKNGLTTLFQFSLSVRPFLLPSLQLLDVSDNPLQKITKEDFIEMQGSPLEVLILKMCGLDWIEPDAFSGFQNLESLDLGKNNLTPGILIDLVISLNSSNPHLKHLGLSGNFLNKNNIQDLFEIISDTHISHLDLSNNHFNSLTSQFFPKMPKIETLDLRRVSAFDVGGGTFSSSLFPSLRNLHFGENRLSGFVSGLRIPNLKELDLSGNQCLACPVQTLFDIGDNYLQDMKSLEVLHLSNNNLYHISRFTFFGLEALRILYLSNCSLITIADHAFSDLSTLEHLDLSNNHYLASDKLISATFDGLTSLISLRLDYCRITNLDPEVFFYLTSLKYLNLMDNDLMSIDPLLFTPLTKLVRLDLTNNDLLPWNKQIFFNNPDLEHISLSSNHIYMLTSAMILDLFHIDKINIRDNPFKCNCDLVRNLLDSEEKSEIMFGLNDTGVKCQKSDITVAEFIRLNSVNYNCLHWSLYLFIAGVCVVFALIVCSVAMYYMRWYIRYWLFLFKQSWRASFPRRKEIRANSKYKYDAFVSYSNEDRSFVVRMVAMMENYEPYFRLCVFERDFNAGDVICESVVDCLEISRKTILILTDAFARSQWCQWELQMAHHKRFFFKSESQDSLILIKLGDIMDCHMTPTLRYLMKTRIYLQWYPDPKRQRIFWQKLREALNSPGHGGSIEV